jgi:hypothetical protein
MKKEDKKPVPTGEALINDLVKVTHNHIRVEPSEGAVEEFMDIKGHQLHGPYIIVEMKDDTQYVFHMGSVKKLKIWTTKE